MTIFIHAAHCTFISFYTAAPAKNCVHCSLNTALLPMTQATLYLEYSLLTVQGWELFCWVMVGSHETATVVLHISHCQLYI